MHYRIYYLDAVRRLRRAYDFHSSSDVEAKGRLRQADTVGFAAELWEGGRLVACLPQKGCERCPHDPAHCMAEGAVAQTGETPTSPAAQS